MANNSPVFWPKRTGNPAIDEGFYQAFTFLYSLRGNQNTVVVQGNNNGSTTPSSNGSSSGGGGGASGFVNIQHVALTSNNTANVNASVAPTVGALLVVVASQDGNGNGLIAWNNTTFKDVSNSPGVNPLDRNIYLFFGDNYTSNNNTSICWIGAALPLVGQS